MGADFKWGIIGPGRIAHTFAQAVQRTKGASIHAIASRSSKEPDKLKQDFGAEKCYNSYKALAADIEVDAIYIATPHRFHYENALTCLEAGKPVLCEKSFTVNAQQAETLFKKSQENQVFIMEALWTRFLPIYKPVREWIEAGEIGDVRHVHSTLGFIARRDPTDRLLNIELAGGTVLDLGVYTCGLTQWATRDNPQRVLASAHIGETGVDETINVTYQYADGSSAQFCCTFEFEPPNELMIFGSEGSIRVHTSFVNGTVATLEKGKRSRTIKKPLKINGFEYQIEAAMEAIRAGRLDCPQMTHADTLGNMRALDTIRDQIGMRYPFE
jgi:predicted dehydrogenase